MSAAIYYSNTSLEQEDVTECLNDLPRFEKRRRPERNTFKTPIRRAVVRSYRRGGSTSRTIVSGFHRRIIKKPLRYME
jgi:hypothetical protein